MVKPGFSALLVAGVVAQLSFGANADVCRPIVSSRLEARCRAEIVKGKQALQELAKQNGDLLRELSSLREKLRQLEPSSSSASSSSIGSNNSQSIDSVIDNYFYGKESGIDFDFEVTLKNGEVIRSLRNRVSSFLYPISGATSGITGSGVTRMLVMPTFWYLNFRSLLVNINYRFLIDKNFSLPREYSLNLYRDNDLVRSFSSTKVIEFPTYTKQELNLAVDTSGSSDVSLRGKANAQVSLVWTPPIKTTDSGLSTRYFTPGSYTLELVDQNNQLLNTKTFIAQ